MSLDLSGTLVIVYISSLQLTTLHYDAFEASYGVFYESPGWRRYNRSGTCWGREWPACRCRPIAAAIRKVLRDVPKDHHLIIKMQDARVVRYLNERLRERREERVAFDRQGSGQHHDCEGFVKQILPEIEERIAGGALVHIDRVDCKVEEERGGAEAAFDLARLRFTAAHRVEGALRG